MAGLFGFFRKKKNDGEQIDEKKSISAPLPPGSKSPAPRPPGVNAPLPEAKNFPSAGGLKNPKPTTNVLAKSTQRIVLPGQVQAAALMATQRIVLPNQTTTPPMLSPEPEKFTLPVGMVLRLLPEAALIAEAVAQMSQDEEFPLPLNMVVPQLPTGKIELTFEQLLPHLPSRILKPKADLQPLLSTVINLPLMNVVLRIPQDKLSARQDQKPNESVPVATAIPIAAPLPSMPKPSSSQPIPPIPIPVPVPVQVPPSSQELPEATKLSVSQLIPPITKLSASQAIPAVPKLSASQVIPPVPKKFSASQVIPPVPKNLSASQVIPPIPKLSASQVIPPIPPKPEASSTPLPPPQETSLSSETTPSEIPAPSPMESAPENSSLGLAPSITESSSDSLHHTEEKATEPSGIEIADVKSVPAEEPKSLQDLLSAAESALNEQPKPPAQDSSEKEPEVDIPLIPAAVPQEEIKVSEPEVSSPKASEESSLETLQDLQKLMAAAEAALAEKESTQSSPAPKESAEPAPVNHAPEITPLSPIIEDTAIQSELPKPAKIELPPLASVFVEKPEITEPVTTSEDEKPSSEPILSESDSHEKSKIEEVHVEEKPEPMKPLIDIPQVPATSATEAKPILSKSQLIKPPIAPLPPAPETSVTTSSEAINELDLNRCDAETLSQSFGCSKTIAQAIVTERKIRGGFISLENLLSVPGMTSTVYQHITGNLPPKQTLLSLASLVNLPEEAPVTLLQVVARISVWPDVLAVVVGKGDVVLEAELADGQSAIESLENSNRLLDSAGFSFGSKNQQVKQLIVTCEQNSTLILRSENITLTCQLRGTEFPGHYIKTLRKITAEIGEKEGVSS